MKRQYLGDSKDSFKWDYHDFLVSRLGYPVLNVVLMLTPDDDTEHGNTDPESFPARPKIIRFCKRLKRTKDINLIKKLPDETGSQYKVILHKDSYITIQNRRRYFSGFSREQNQLLLIDPDTGFEPPKKSTEKHVLYSDIADILNQISQQSIISVFQHYRRRPFINDFSHIRERLNNEAYCNNVTAIYSEKVSLMFVLMSKSEDIIEKVRHINKKYLDNVRQRVISVI